MYCSLVLFILLAHFDYTKIGFVWKIAALLVVMLMQHHALALQIKIGRDAMQYGTHYLPSPSKVIFVNNSDGTYSVRVTIYLFIRKSTIRMYATSFYFADFDIFRIGL